MTSFLLKTIDTRVTPLAYLAAAQGLIWGMAFVFLHDLDGVQNTILFKQSALIGVSWWGVLSLVASLLMVIGMLCHFTVTTAAGAVGMWVAWVFALVIYVAGCYWFLAVLAVVNILVYGYIYLSARLGLLWLDSDE